MPNCNSCSAPLPANSQCCRYCGVRNDIDIQGRHDYHLVQKTSERWCPQCRVPLHSIALPMKKPLVIERCEHCFGLFFDPGEIEIMLENATAPATSINVKLLDNINQDRYRSGQAFKYLKCPVCDVMMNRVAFGHRSGVVVDRCHNHGIWLDGGEISHLLEWKRAGGQLWDEQKRLEAQTKPRRSDAKTDISRVLEQNQRSDSDWSALGHVAEILFSLFQ